MLLQVYEFTKKIFVTVFIGTLKDIVQDPNTLLHRMYFKIDQFIKYDGVYTGRLHAYQNHICSNHSNVPSTATHTPKWPNVVPMEGIVKVYSESPLAAAREKHLVAGSLYRLGGKRRMVLCCLDEDEHYTVSVLKNLIFHQFCECH